MADLYKRDRLNKLFDQILKNGDAIYNTNRMERSALINENTFVWNVFLDFPHWKDNDDLFNTYVVFGKILLHHMFCASDEGGNGELLEAYYDWADFNFFEAEKLLAYLTRIHVAGTQCGHTSLDMLADLGYIKSTHKRYVEVVLIGDLEKQKQALIQRQETLRELFA